MKRVRILVFGGLLSVCAAGAAAYLMVNRRVGIGTTDTERGASRPSSTLALRRNEPEAIKTVREEVWDLVNPESGSGHDHAAVERFQKLASITGVMSDLEVQECCRFLVETKSIKGITDGMLDTIKNDLINRLSEQPSALPKLRYTLLVIQEDATQSDVIRDYAVQHLSNCYESMPDRGVARKAFWVRVHEDRATIGATALLAIDRIAQANGLDTTENQRLEDVAQKLIESSTATENAKIAALQVLRRTKSAQVLGFTKDTIETQASYPLTVACIGAMGEIGGEQELRMLEEFRQKSGRQFSVSVDYAVKAISERLQAAEK